MSHEDVFGSHFDLGKFRYAIAAYVKYLIRARWKRDPGFLSESELGRWGLHNIDLDRFPDWRLLGMAADALGRLHDDFIPMSSGGIADAGDDTPEGRLYSAAGSLTSGGQWGPWYNEALYEAVGRFQDSGDTTWVELVEWGSLAAIRDDLDRLPHWNATPVSGEKCGPVVTCNNRFVLIGSSWNVQYNGGQLFAMADSPGLFYIHHLLEKQLRPVGTPDLSAAWNRRQNTVRGVASDDQAASEGLEAISGADPVIDDKTLRNVGKSIQDLSQRRASLDERADVEEIARLNRELEELEAYRRGAYSPTGQRRKLKDPAQQITNTVSRAINRAIERIRKSEQILATHLLNHIEVGSVCRYAPGTFVKWEL